ncbi:MAG: hypothetical protein IPP35_03040 [Elusimicrobia bacterium]|nr:hypothetical protein [Elusimicrobiota bacterium]
MGPLKKIVVLGLAFLPGVLFAADPIPMSEDVLVFQLKKSTGAYAAKYGELDETPLALDHCPSSSEVKRKGQSRNSDKMEGYASAFYEGIRLLKDNPAQTLLVSDMKQAIVRMGDDVISAAIQIDGTKWGWNNLSSDWEAWANGTCTNNTTPDLYDSGRSLMVLGRAFETTTDMGKKRDYYDAFIKGVHYWLDDRANPYLAAGSSYAIVRGTLKVKDIQAFFNLKPNNEILNLAIVGGQRTDVCPGPGCNDGEKALNLLGFSTSTYTLPRPFRFHYTADDPALVSVNCSGLLGLAMLKMGLTLARLNDPAFPMPTFDIKVATRDGLKTAKVKKSLLYLGHWTMYSLYYNLAQTPSNASYDDVDTPQYKTPTFEAHFGTLTAPALAEAGALLQRQEYLDAAARSLRENMTALKNYALGIYTMKPSSSPVVFAVCSMRNLDPAFSQECDSQIYNATHYASGAATRLMSPNWIGVSLLQGIVPVSGTPDSVENLMSGDRDDTPPVVSITAPVVGTIYPSSRTVAVTAGVSDAGGVARVVFVVDGTPMVTDTAAPFAASLINLAPGSHSLAAQAYDVAGNSVVSLPVSILVDHIPPTAPSGLTATVTQQTLGLSWSLSTDSGGGGVAGYRVDMSTDTEFASFVPGWNGRDVGLAVSTSASVQMFDTVYYVRVRAVDGAGNLSPFSSVVPVKLGAFNDDFNTEAVGISPSRWSVTMASQTNAAISGDVFAGVSGKSAYLTDDNLNGYCQLQYLSGQKINTFYYRANVRFRETRASHYVLLGNGNATSVYFINAHSDATWSFYDGAKYVRFLGDTKGYAANTWYQVEVRADLTIGRFSVWVDRVLVGDNLPIPGSNSSISGIRMLPASAPGAGGMWVDDVLLTTALPFYDDFESENVGTSPSRWGVNSSAAQTAVTVAADATSSGGAKSLSLADDNPGGYCHLQYLAGQSVTTFYYRAHVRFREANSSHYVFLGNGNATSVYFINAHSDATWSFYDGAKYVRFAGDTKGYAANTWYVIEILADFAGGRFSAWVNGVLVGDNVPIPGGNTWISGFRLLPASSPGKGALWVDNLFFDYKGIQTGVLATSPIMTLPVPLVAPQSVDGARAYPVPFRPGGATVLTFDRIPGGAEIRLFTMEGRPVKTLVADNGGVAPWDLTNENGEAVASGVYLALIGKDGEQKRIKVVVQK